jgi:putative FmdB family regulatory protein
MPFYEYQCKACGHTLEAMQKVNDSPLRKCPDCGKSQLTRLMSAPVFRLKGGGWYETDFKGEQDHKKNLADRPETDTAAGDAKPADAKVEAKGDAKPDVKAGDTAAKTDKPAEKAAAKATPTEPTKKAAAGISRRGTTATRPPARPTAKKAAKKPAAKSKARR